VPKPEFVYARHEVTEPAGDAFPESVGAVPPMVYEALLAVMVQLDKVVKL
jgi:hypothetical protein